MTAKRLFPRLNSYGICFRPLKTVQYSSAYPSCFGERHGIPFFELVCAFHLVDIHADFVLDVRRGGAGVVLQVLEHDTGPVFVLLQKLLGFVHQMPLTGDGLKLIQVQTL